MLRKWGYILTSALLMLGSLATIGKAVTMMDTDVSYGDSRALYFKVSKKDTTYNGVLAENYIQQTDGYGAVDEVAEEMKDRLENWNIEAEVNKEGYDTIKVVVRTASQDDTEYRYLQDYLSFSGQDITIGVGAPTQDLQKGAPSHPSYRDNAMFDGHTAQIEYINNVPVVTIEVNAQGESGELNELIKYASDNSHEADSSASTEASYSYIVLWNHMQEGDNYLDATNTSSEDYDPNMAKRLVFGESAANAWYVDSNNENNNYKKFQLVPNSDAIKDGNFDSSKAGAAYKAALYYCSVLNANAYDYDITFDYSVTVPASIDALTQADDWHLSIHWGPTMIACVVALAVAAVVLSLFYHLGALSILSNGILAAEFGILLFAYFGAQFGIGALIGFILGVGVTMFGGAYYFSKLKEEMYKGRTLKKAEAEAYKKSVWPMIDANIVSLILGLCVYGLVPGAVGKFGLALILTVFFGTIFNFTLGKLEGWMLANDNDCEKHPGATYFLDESRIPNLMADQKQTYFGPYAEKDFGKHKKIWSIAGGALCLASIIGMSIFAPSKNGIFNYAGAYENTTSIAVEYRVQTDSLSTRTMSTKDQLNDNLLSRISYEDKALTEYIQGEVSLENTTVSINDGLQIVQYTVYHFQVPLTTYFDAETLYPFSIDGTNSETYLTSALQEVIDTNADADNITVSANRITYEAGSPTMGSVYLAGGIATLVLLVYFALRFRLSRAVPSSVFAIGSAVIVGGFFSLTRLAVTPVVSLAILSTIALGFYFALYPLNKERELIKDSREKDKKALSFRNEMLKMAGSQSAGDTIVATLIALGVCLPFLAIAPQVDRMIFLGTAIGALLVLALTLTLLPSLSIQLSLGLNAASRSVRTSWDNRPRSKKSQQKKKNNEPEEAIFIGIND